MRKRLFTGLLLLVAASSVLFLGAGIDGAGGGKGRTGGSTSGVVKPGIPSTQALDAYLFWVNNIIMPVASNGVLANVTVGGVSQGAYQNPDNGVLFSGGFFLSGITPTSTGPYVWSNAVASASRVQDYKPGTAKDPSKRGGIYVLDKGDPPFGTAWQSWAEAVAMGADFYDGNGDGQYNPVDLNANGLWDPTEDAPDLLGDQTAWFVINDNEDPTRRRWVGIEPQGIDIQQSLFGFRSAGSIGNILFVRYRIINRGTKADVIDSVLFGLWADSDLGDAYDDFVGVDRSIDAGYTWNDGPDNVFGPQAPCFMISFFQGPIDSTGNPADTAISVRGQLLGVQRYPGFRNLPISSFVNYIQSDPTRGDPATHIEARNYLSGRLKLGTILDPCTDPQGAVRPPVLCDTLNRNFWYSGDPVTNTGWLYAVAGDMRQMQNVGPFKLVKDKPLDIVAAYIVGRGSDAANSVAVGRQIARLSKRVYDANFEGAPSPPIVQPTARTTDNSIELLWETKNHIPFRVQSSVFGYDLRFEAFEVWSFNRNSTALVEAGQENAKVIARYDVANKYGDMLFENPNGTRTPLLTKGIQLDSAVYADPLTGRIRLRITTDPWTGGPILKGKPYFFSVVGYAVDWNGTVKFNAGDPNSADIITASPGFTANSLSILNGSNGGIRPGFDQNLSPYLQQVEATQASGYSTGKVKWDEVEKEDLTGHVYEVSFLRNPDSVNYAMMWRLRDTTTNTIKLDSIPDNYRPDANSLPAYNQPVVDGMMVQVAGVGADVVVPAYGGRRWYRTFSADGGTGVYYLGKDVPVVSRPDANTAVTTRPAEFSGANNLATYSSLRNIVIRFGQTQKAYRYIKAGNFGDNSRYIYAAGTPATSGLDTLPNFRRGYVDVPFQVWVNDTKTREQYQVNCAFLENFRAPRRPDGVWDPWTKVGGADGEGSKEYIVVFNSRYSPDTLLQYTGGVFPNGTRWATMTNGWTLPAADTAFLSPELRAVAADKYMGALYTVGLERLSDTSFYAAGDSLVMPMTYAFTAADRFYFRSNAGGQNFTQEDRKQLWEKVNVYPNPMFAYNPTSSYLAGATSYSTNGISGRPDEPFVTFTNLPERVTVKIFTLMGVLVRTLDEGDKILGTNSPFLEWNLQNEDGLRVASGMYLVIVSSPEFGDKVLKLAVIMPQKQIQRY